MAIPCSSSLSHLSFCSKSQPNRLILTRPEKARFKCSAGQTGFFTRLSRLIKEKAKSDVEKIFSGFSKTRDNLAVVDELLLYWNLADTDRVLDELEEVLFFNFLFFFFFPNFLEKFFPKVLQCLNFYLTSSLLWWVKGSACI